MIPSKSRRRSTRMTCLILALLMSIAGPAAADESTHNDPDDTSGRLDIASIRQYHRAFGSQRLLAYDIATHPKSPNSTWGAASTITMSFNTDDDKAVERRLLIDVETQDNSLQASFLDSRGNLLGYAKTVRIDERNITVEFPKRALRKNLTEYSWIAVSSFSHSDSENCSSVGGHPQFCIDRAPETVVTHTLG